MSEQEMLQALRSIIVQATQLYQAIARAPALTFAPGSASTPAHANSEVKKMHPSRKKARTA